VDEYMDENMDGPACMKWSIVGQNGNCRVVLVVTKWAVPLCPPYYRPKRKEGLGGPPLLILIYPKKIKNKNTHFEVCIYSFSFGFFFKENNST
jgi:hypothetical protein